MQLNVITHPGAFHADEVLAIAFLKKVKNPDKFILVRSIPTPEELASPNVWVLDVGQQWTPELNNFDHHQNGELEATNMLILKHLYAESEISFDVYQGLYPFFKRVSDIDRGIEKSVYATEFNSIIRCMNASFTFDSALAYAEATVDAIMSMINKKIVDKIRWTTEVVLKEGFALQRETNPIAGWIELAEQDEIKYLVTPNIRGGWQIISRDSVKFPVLEHPMQSFLHTAKFLAVYPDQETAEMHAKELATLHNDTIHHQL